MGDIFYRNCVCPKCKLQLDDVEEGAPGCPGCGEVLDRTRVWETRKYPGVVVLPHWVRAFGWPFLLILAGIGLFFWGYCHGIIDFKLPSLMMALGLIFFFVKLTGADRGI